MSGNKNRRKKNRSGRRTGERSARPRVIQTIQQRPESLQEVPWRLRALSRAFSRDGSRFDTRALWRAAISLQDVQKQPLAQLSEVRLVRFKVSQTNQPRLNALVLATKCPKQLLSPDVSIALLALRVISGPPVTFRINQVSLTIGSATWIPAANQLNGYLASAGSSVVSVLFGVTYSKRSVVNYYQHPPSVHSLPVALGIDRLRLRQLRSGAIDLHLPTATLVWTLPADYELQLWTEAQQKEARKAKLMAEFPNLLVPQVVETDPEEKSNSSGQVPPLGEAVNFREDLRLHDAGGSVPTVVIEKLSFANDADELRNQFWLHSPTPQTVRVSLTVNKVRVRIKPADLVEVTQGLLFA